MTERQFSINVPRREMTKVGLRQPALALSRMTGHWGLGLGRLPNPGTDIEPRKKPWVQHDPIRFIRFRVFVAVSLGIMAQGAP